MDLEIIDQQADQDELGDDGQSDDGQAQCAGPVEFVFIQDAIGPGFDIQPGHGIFRSVSHGSSFSSVRLLDLV